MNAELAHQQELEHQQAAIPQSDALYPNILICGGSGTGKSTSLRGLNYETTAIINTERKVLPFREARKFTKQRSVSTLAEFNQKLNAALSSDSIKVIVIDSFTSLAEMAYTEIVGAADKSGDGAFKAWGDYRDFLHGVLLRSKSANKFVVFIAIEESIQDEMQRITKTVAVQGSLKGKIAKEFEIALWTKIVDAEDQSDQYKFVTNGDPSNESKSPMGMFEDKLIPNDLNQVLEASFEYFNGEL